MKNRETKIRWRCEDSGYSELEQWIVGCWKRISKYFVLFLKNLIRIYDIWVRYISLFSQNFSSVFRYFILENDLFPTPNQLTIHFSCIVFFSIFATSDDQEKVSHQKHPGLLLFFAC